MPNSSDLTTGSSQTQRQSSSGLAAPLEYNKPIHGIDEVFNLDGSVKPQWDFVLHGVRELGSQEMAKREEKIRRILRDDGASYNLYDHDYSTNQNDSNNWELDAVPHVVGSEDWGTIESGLLERAELFNLLLRDIYGERSLISSGVLPPEALFSHAGYLRPCQGISLPGEHDLILHAVDLVRRSDGSMCVLSDRTQAPSGVGYALENRTVMSRVFPSLYRDSHVHRLASFYQRLRQTLTALSPNEQTPLIVLLTPGSQTETYFENAYLANYLGYPLVQSGDLVVRNGFVWMKSLEGLKRVDVILRRVDDLDCDPVELSNGSGLGVPGLLEIVRSGRVAVANPIGAGILENPVLHKFLPAISKHLIGRELRLDTVTTYWGGDEHDLKYITSNIRQLIIKPAYRGGNTSSVWGGALTEQQINELVAEIHRKRYHYVAQERMDKPRLPTFATGALESRPSLLRTYAVAADNSYTILPGGLTRIGATETTAVVNMQMGSPSKDTWVISTEPERTANHPVALGAANARSQSPLFSLPSRVVENLYWLGRYAERAEASLRFLRTVFVLLNSEEPISKDARRVLLQTVSQVTGTLPGFAEASDELLANPDAELLMVIKDDNRLGSIKSTLNSMLASADESKEMLSTDTMRVINDLRDATAELENTLKDGLTSAPEEALDPLVTALAALSGLMQESMIRLVGWRFMELGKRIERAQQTINAVRSLITPVLTDNDRSILQTALLLSMEVLITYRRRGRENRGIELGLELVLLDSNNPRSLIFQLERMEEHLSKLPRTDSGVELAEEDRVLLEAITSLKLSRLSGLLQSDSGERVEMDQLLSNLERLLEGFSGLLSSKHFDHRTDPQQLVTTFWGSR